MRIEIKNGQAFEFQVKRKVGLISEEVIQTIQGEAVQRIEAKTKSKVVVAPKSDQTLIMILSEMDHIDVDRTVLQKVKEELSGLVDKRGGEDRNVLEFVDKT